MRLSEGSALEQLLDVIKNGDTTVGPDILAPAPVENNIYDELSDPEVLEEELQEYELSRWMNRLNEAAVTAASLIRSFMKSKSQDKSYQSFLSSEWGDDSIDFNKFKTYVKNQLKKGDYNLTEEQQAQSMGSVAGAVGSRTSKRAAPTDDNFYSPPEIKDGERMSAGAEKLAKTYQEDPSAEGSAASAQEQFDNMYDIVADIATGEATNRHALIWGDPGCGKSMSGDIKIIIQIEDHIKEQLEKYLSKLK
jgi:hypothetical protein